MADAAPIPIKRLVLRAVLKDVSPIMARVISVPDQLQISELHDVFLSMLGCTQSPDLIIRIHAQEYASFRRIRIRQLWRLFIKPGNMTEAIQKIGGVATK